MAFLDTITQCAPAQLAFIVRSLKVTSVFPWQPWISLNVEKSVSALHESQTTACVLLLELKSYTIMQTFYGTCDGLLVFAPILPPFPRLFPLSITQLQVFMGNHSNANMASFYSARHFKYVKQRAVFEYPQKAAKERNDVLRE